MTTATRTKVHNYSAGPCILPQEVFEEAARAVLDFEGSGLSILEMSHRSKPFEAVMAKAQALVKELLGAPEHYQVVFLDTPGLHSSREALNVEMVKIAMDSLTEVDVVLFLVDVALSLPEMIILRKVLSLKLIAVFVGVVGMGILAVGFLFNALFI